MGIGGITSKRLRAAALAAFAGLALAACGSSSGNGIGSSSATAILAAASKALSTVHSVRINGTTKSSGTSVGLDLSVVAGKGATGTLILRGRSVQIISVAGKLYMNGNSAFWQRLGNSTAASLFAGKWIESPTGVSSFGKLFDLHSLLGSALQQAKLDKSLQKGATTTIDGQSVIAVTDPRKSATLYVATSGPAYPLELLKKGTSSGRIVFSDYNQPVTLKAPAHVTPITG